MNFFPPAMAYPLTIASLLLAMGLLLWNRKATVGLTLSGPWWWSIISLATLAAVESMVTWLPSYAVRSVSEPLRFLALMSLFMPLMSLLGAKRPQHQAWHFIVFSLWIVLALPAAETLFLQRGQALEVYDARCWFLLAMVIITALNIGLVRWWPSALLIAIAEAIMLADYLPGLRASTLPEIAPGQRIAVGCFLIAIAVATMLGQLSRRRSVPAWDRLWLAFRDAFGALWAIRIAEQINQVAEQQQWSFRVHWAGFRTATTGEPLSESPFEQQPTLVQVVENLLRRFVNRDWIEEKLGSSLTHLKQSTRSESDS